MVISSIRALSSMPVAAFSVIAVLVQLLPAAAGDLGASSTVTCDTQIQMLVREGGGYITWEISGDVVKTIRANIDQRWGNNDGTVQSGEGNAYTSELDTFLENSYIRYGCSRIVRTSLLTKDIHVDTTGLLAPVNDSRNIVIHFYFNANLRTDSATVNFADTAIPLSPFRVLNGSDNQTFAGKLVWKHTEVLVGLSSYASGNPERGKFTRFRGPGAEVVWYEVTIQNEQVQDTMRFETFNALECSVELFVVVCIFAVMAILMPRYYMKEKKMKKVGWLHGLAILLVVFSLLIFFTGVDGLFVWLSAPFFGILSWVLSYGIYVRRWRDIAQSAIVVPVSTAPEPGASKKLGSSSYAASKELMEPPAQPIAGALTNPASPQELMRQESPAFPAGEKDTSAPPTVEEPTTQMRKIKCPKCKVTFDVADNGLRPLPIKCTACGAEGSLKK